MARSNGRFVEPITTEIKVWMARRRLNQGELAARIGVDQSWVSKRLSMKTTLTVEDLGLMADALGVPAAEFYRKDEGQSINYRSSA